MRVLVACYDCEKRSFVVFMQELTFKEIYNAILPKFKMLLIILLIGAVVGGCIGVARAYSSIAYGTTIEFYVNPKRSGESENNQSQFGVYGAYGWHVMDNMTKLLASESFAEDMLLDDDGLPIDSVIKNDVNKAKLDAKIAEAREAISKVKNAEESENEITEEQLAALKADAQKKRSDAIELWRQCESYSTAIATITHSVSYSFYNDTDMQVSNTETLAKSFIYVKISTANNEDTAKFIYDRINKILPRFVEANMAVPSGYIGTNCQRITRLDGIKQTGAGNLLDSAVKYAAILGTLALVLATIFVVCVDRFKKWRELNESTEGAGLNTSDVTLGDGAVSSASEITDKAEGAPEWQ